MRHAGRTFYLGLDQKERLRFAPTLSAYLHRSVRSRVINTFDNSGARQVYLDSLASLYQRR